MVEIELFGAIAIFSFKKAPVWSDQKLYLLWNSICLQLSICPLHCFEVNPLLKQNRAHWNKTRGRAARNKIFLEYITELLQGCKYVT